MENLSTDTSHIREWRSIITLIAFFLANIAVLFPFHIPLPIPRFLWNATLSILTKLRIIPPRTEDAVSSSHHHEEATTGFFRMTNFPINMVTAPLIADLFLLATLSIGRAEVYNGIVGSNNIDPIDVMVFFITLAYIALSIDASGLIRYLACRVLKASSSGRRLYFYLYAFFFGLTTCIGNDPIILSGTPFLAYITRVSNIQAPTAWIYAQFAIANIASAILVSSNPTNLVLTAAFSVRFIDYTANIIVPVLFTVVLLFPFLLFVVFRDPGFIPPTIEMQKLEHLDGGEEEAPPVNPNIPYAQYTGPGGGDPEQQGIREVLNPYLDRWGATFAAVIMAATLITVLALNASTGGHVPVYWVTLPAAVVMFCWDVVFGWLNRYETRELASRGQREAERAEVARAIGAAQRQSGQQQRRQVEGLNEKSDSGHGAGPGAGNATDVEHSDRDDNTIRPAPAPVPVPLVPQSSKDDDEKSGTTAADADLERQISWELQLQRRQRPVEQTTLVSLIRDARSWARATFPTATTVLSLLPFPLVPFAFAMFVLVEALVTKGWVPVFAYGWHHWVEKTGTVGAIGGMGFVSVVLCNVSLPESLMNLSFFNPHCVSRHMYIYRVTNYLTPAQFSGTNIGTTILLCRIIQTWQQIHANAGTALSDRTFWGTVYSMAVGVNYGAFSSAFSASLAGLLWRDILAKKGIRLRRTGFLRVNVPIISVAMTVGLAVLVGEIYVIRGEQEYAIAA
ncbi:arsenite efflux transporter [Apiospora arundinis]|uniref:Arsenite efflux transporter n=1 Tax=Apiospora arundinis TaxID=335852 RepID=A0ABR2J406_9PEZI